MKFRFTLNNSIAGSHEISEPDGWKDVKLKLQRHPEYHCLVLDIDTPFFFYNIGQGKDGGRDYLYNVEQTQGINAIVSLLIELSENNGNTWDVVFLGNLDLSTIKDTSKGDKFYRFQCEISPGDLWAKFQNRKSIKVNLNDLIDLNGNAITAPDNISLELLAQKVRQQYQATTDFITYDYTIPISNFISFDFSNVVLDEIATKNTLPPGIDSIGPSIMWSVKYSGTYTFDIKVVCTAQNYLGAFLGLNSKLRMWFLINPLIPSGELWGLIESHFSTYSEYTLTQTFDLKKDDVLFLYGQSLVTFDVGYLGPDATIPKILWISGDNNNESPLLQFHNIPGTTHMNVVANTIYPQTRTDALLIHDSASAIVKRITGGLDIYSEYLGGSLQGYASDGCGYLYALMLGLHVRGYSFADKPFAMSFDDWFNGADPIFNLGIGVEVRSGVEVLRIEQKDHFYNDTPILYFDNVEWIERKYDSKLIIKSIKSGYANWSAESASGIDDSQTSQTRSTIYEMIGVEITKLSSWFAAALGIEQTRRNRAEQSKDWRLDNNTIIISVDKNISSSPDYFIAEVGSPFTSVTNLLNPDSRYNLRITPLMNFRRHLKLFSASLQKYLTKPFKFNSGEGNYVMAIGANSDTCDPGTGAENQDILPSNSPYTTHEQYTLSKDLSWIDWKTWIANKDRCVAARISPNDTYKNIHVESVIYNIPGAKVDITGWIK